MKIYPQDFKRNAKSAKSAIKHTLGIKVPSTKLNDCLAKAYGWQHYHELHKAEVRKQPYSHELELGYDSYLNLVECIFESVFNLAIATKINDIETRFCIKLSGMAQPPKEILDFIHHIEKKIEMGALKNTDFARRYNVQLEEKRKLKILKGAFVLNGDQLRTHSLLFNRNHETRMLNLLKIFSSQYFREGRGLWFLTKSEFRVLKPRLTEIVGESSIIVIDENDEQFDLRDYFTSHEANHASHHFFVYPDYGSKENNSNLRPPELFIQQLRKAASDVLNGDISRSKTTVIAPKPILQTTLYINESICTLSETHPAFIAQCRCLGIASIIGTNSYREAYKRLGEHLHALLANSHIRSYDSDDLSGMKKAEDALNIDSRIKGVSFPEKSSIISLPSQNNPVSPKDYVLLDQKATITQIL